MQPLKFKDYPVNIFHGWQPNKEYRKGNIFFDEALNKLMNNYPDKVNYQIVGGLPYEEYIKTFNDSHIFLDQCMSMDQGVNALLALAKGKVVFPVLMTIYVIFTHCRINLYWILNLMLSSFINN